MLSDGILSVVDSQEIAVLGRLQLLIYLHLQATTIGSIQKVYSSLESFFVFGSITVSVFSITKWTDCEILKLKAMRASLESGRERGRLM